MKDAIRSALLSTLLISAAIMAMSQQPGESTRGGQNMYLTQDARDAVQDQKLNELDEWRKSEMILMQEVRDSQKFATGGLWGFGAVLTFLQIMQFLQMRKK